jgi:hypothetical protein
MPVAPDCTFDPLPADVSLPEVFAPGTFFIDVQATPVTVAAPWSDPRGVGRPLFRADFRASLVPRPPANSTGCSSSLPRISVCPEAGDGRRETA